MPSARTSLPAFVVLALALAAPPVSGDTSVDGPLHGYGTAATFDLRSGPPGYAVRDVAHDVVLACGACSGRILFTDAALVVLPGGSLEFVLPGAYELVDFQGTIGISKSDDGYFLQLHGDGALVPA